MTQIVTRKAHQRQLSFIFHSSQIYDKYKELQSTLTQESRFQH